MLEPTDVETEAHCGTTCTVYELLYIDPVPK